MRGRWKGALPETIKSSGMNEAPKAGAFEREYRKLEAASRTALGQGLLEVCKPVVQWRNHEITAGEASQAAGQAYLKFVCSHGRQGMDSDGLDRALGEIVGSGTFEEALIEGGVMRAVASGIQLQWVGGKGGVAIAWWVRITRTPGALGIGLTGIPKHPSVSKEVAAALGVDGVSLDIHPYPVNDSRFVEHRKTAWSDRWATGLSMGRQLAMDVRHGSRSTLAKQYWLGSMKETDSRRHLVVVSAGSLDAVKAARERWKQGAQALERALMQALSAQAEGRGAKVQVAHEVEGYLWPYVSQQQRAALLVGLIWNEDEGKGCLTEKQK